MKYVNCRISLNEGICVYAYMRRAAFVATEVGLNAHILVRPKVSIDMCRALHFFHKKIFSYNMLSNVHSVDRYVYPEEGVSLKSEPQVSKKRFVKLNRRQHTFEEISRHFGKSFHKTAVELGLHGTL